MVVFWKIWASSLTNDIRAGKAKVSEGSDPTARWLVLLDAAALVGFGTILQLCRPDIFF